MATEFRLTIPEEAHEGFAQLLGLSDAVYSKIEAALQDATPTLYRSDLAAFVAQRVGEDQDRIEEIVWFLLSLYRVRAKLDLDVPTFVEGVCQGLKAENDTNLSAPQHDWSTFKNRLARLLSFDESLGITSKALDVKREHEHLYCPDGSRVVTDVRPIFQDDLSAAPTVAMIVHTLKIAYHEATELKEIYVALDSNDVEHLRGILERAEEKAESLQLLLKSANVRILDREVK